MHPYFCSCWSRFSILMDMAVMFLILRLTPHRWSILQMGSSMQLLTLIIIKVTGSWLAFDLWHLCSLIDLCFHQVDMHPASTTWSCRSVVVTTQVMLLWGCWPALRRDWPSVLYFPYSNVSAWTQPNPSWPSARDTVPVLF